MVFPSVSSKIVNKTIVKKIKIKKTPQAPQKYH